MSVSGDRKMTKRLEMLKASLVKKEAELDRRMQAHFDTVKEANGQPLNDKRNGQATLNKWEKQNDAIRNQQAEIEKTKRAIEFEEGKIAHVGSVSVPSFITDLIDAGEITQWRKYLCSPICKVNYRQSTVRYFLRGFQQDKSTT